MVMTTRIKTTKRPSVPSRVVDHDGVIVSSAPEAKVASSTTGLSGPG